MEDRYKTLFFASSTTTSMTVVGGGSVAYSGLYKCVMDEEADPDYQTQRCGEAQKLANGLNRDGKSHSSLSLHNLQFHNGNLETTKHSHNQKKPSPNNDVPNTTSTTTTPTERRPSYVYANTFVDNHRDHPEVRVGSWEILRAELTPATVSGSVALEFRSLFRTLEAFDWNECDFGCCPYDPTSDDDPFALDSAAEENGYYSHMHAYVRTKPRSFALDASSGDVFVSWEGFYQTCDPAAGASGGKKLVWTIGVSRLRTEDPYCVTDQARVLENNFPRCTEPVSIVYQGPKGRDAVLPRGGFHVVPADSASLPRRSFVLSVLKSTGNDSGKGGGDVVSQVWVVPEGGRATGDVSLDGGNSNNNNTNGTVIDASFMDEGIWDGGTLRLHYDPVTGRPDYLCRSIWDAGIGCRPVSAIPAGSHNRSVHVFAQADEEWVLTKERVDAFCRHHETNADHDDPNHNKHRQRHLEWGHQAFVTGFDVVWKESSERGVSPHEIVFACSGGASDSYHKRMGSITIDPTAAGKASPVQVVVQGAAPSSVLFLPKNLQDALPVPAASEEASSAPATTMLERCNLSGTTLLATSLLCFAWLLAWVVRRKHRRRPWSRFSIDDEGRKSALRCDTTMPYVELPTIDSSLSSSSSSNHSSRAFLYP